MANLPLEEIEKIVGSRYALTVLAGKRAKELREGAPRLVNTDSTNSIIIALQEILEGKIAPEYREAETVVRIVNDEALESEAAEALGLSGNVEELARGLADELDLSPDAEGSAEEPEETPAPGDIATLVADSDDEGETEDDDDESPDVDDEVYGDDDDEDDWDDDEEESWEDGDDQER